jgi:hypothetical protein
MNTRSDFEDFFRLLESNGVDYMIVGGFAVAYHGAPRFTKDIDGVTFAEAPAGVVRGRYGSVEVTFIGPDDLLRNKHASGRHQDLGDVEELT